MGKTYHLEVQSTDDPKMVLRMLHYYALILENYGREPYQTVVKEEGYLNAETS